MSIVLVAAVTLLFAAPAIAQGAYLWANDSSASTDAAAAAMALDASGNVFVVGSFQGTVDFGGGELASTSGTVDGFVVEYDSGGNHVWSRTFASSDTVNATGVAVDDSGNLYVSGVFLGSVDFGGGAIASAGAGGTDFDGFVVKYDGGRNHVWSHGFGSSNTSAPVNVGVDAAGNASAVGSFSGSVDFGGGAIMSAGFRDVFVVQYDNTGAHSASRRLGGTGDDLAAGLSVDATGNMAIVGTFSGTGDFGGVPIVSNGGFDAFIAQYDGAGAHVCSRAIGGVLNDFGGGVTVDVFGNVTITGTFQVSADFGGGPIVSAGSFDAFVAQYDGAGDHVWSRRIGGSAIEVGEAVAADAFGNVAVTGAFQNSVDFGGGALMAAGNVDVFVAQYGPAGDHLWSRGFGNIDNDLGADVATNALGDVTVAGFFFDTVDFGGGDLGTATTTNMFVAQYTGSPAVLQTAPAMLQRSIIEGIDAPAQSFTVTNAGHGILNYTISDDAAWLSVSPGSGSSSGEADEITVTYATASLLPGTYNATITIDAPTPASAPQQVAVEIDVHTVPVGGLSAGGGGCFIATATYGTPMAEDVNALRDLRDAYLLNNILGTAFADAYYRISPPVADAVSRSPLLQATVRMLLTPIIAASKLAVVTPGLALTMAFMMLTTSVAIGQRRKRRPAKARIRNIR